jgi:hypothetical protein
MLSMPTWQPLFKPISPAWNFDVVLQVFQPGIDFKQARETARNNFDLSACGRERGALEDFQGLLSGETPTGLCLNMSTNM